MLTESVPLSSNGRVVIPAEFRRAMGLQPGQSVIFRMTESGDLLLTTRDRAIKGLQALFKQYCPEYTLDQYLEEKHAEARLENGE